jgi:hypothetical protein
MTDSPRYNQQFGQTIGVDDVSPPKVAHGRRRPGETRVVDDPNQPGAVRFVVPLDKPPPPEQASWAAEAGVRDDAGPSNAADIPEAPSVWEARRGDERK